MLKLAAAVIDEFPCEVAVTVTLIGNVPLDGAMKRPLLSIVPPFCVLTAQLTFWAAENCQFAPAPICEG
jgi:hypothetical protein